MTYVNCISIFFTFCYTGNLITVCIKTILIDVGLTVNLQLISLQRGVRTNCQAVIADRGLTCGYSSCFYINSSNLTLIAFNNNFVQIHLILVQVNVKDCAAVFRFLAAVNGDIFISIGNYVVSLSNSANIINLLFYVTNTGVDIVDSVYNGCLATVLVQNAFFQFRNIAYVTCFCYVFDYYLFFKFLAIFIKNV